METVLTIDVGGTKTQIAEVTLTNSNIEILNSITQPTPKNPQDAITLITNTCEQWGNKKHNISLSLPGKWDTNGKLIESINLKTWIDFPFISELSKELNPSKIIYETDVICGALGEHYVHSKTCHGMSLLYLNMGTGIGAAFIKDGKPFKNDDLLTLRVQKMAYSANEEIHSATDLLSGSSLLKFSNYNSIENLFVDYKKAKPEAINIISEAQTQLAALLINLFYLFAPKIVVLNGGLTYDWEVLCEEGIDIANEELKEQVKILPSRLKEMAPIYGAYYNFIKLFLMN